MTHCRVDVAASALWSAHCVSASVVTLQTVHSVVEGKALVGCLECLCIEPNLSFAMHNVNINAQQSVIL